MDTDYDGELFIDKEPMLNKKEENNLPVVSLIMVGLCGTLSLTALTANVDILAVRWHGFVTDYHRLAGRQCGQNRICHGCLAWRDCCPQRIPKYGGQYDSFVSGNIYQ